MRSDAPMHIGLLEDDPTLADEVCTLLQRVGHRVTVFADGLRLLQAVVRESFDLLVLDWHVPGATGLEVLQHLRGLGRQPVPVVFLTSNHAEEQIVMALQAGADDYCTKPLRPAEFLARVAVLQRRLVQPSVTAVAEPVEGYVFNRIDRTVLVEGSPVTLTEKEFELSHLLFQNLGRPLGRQRIMAQVWGREEDALSRTLDVHISWVRRKLRIGAQGTRVRINVVHGFGYRLDLVDQADQPDPVDRVAHEA